MWSLFTDHLQAWLGGLAGLVLALLGEIRYRRQVNQNHKLHERLDTERQHTEVLARQVAKDEVERMSDAQAVKAFNSAASVGAVDADDRQR